jgi:DNA-binding transcriptional MocR family regulator
MRTSMGMSPNTIVTRDSGGTLVEQIVHSVACKIDDKLLRTGARMPSIRQFADEQKVSRFTVVEAYDRLVANGYLESRRGSGFFVRERASLISSNSANSSSSNPNPNMPFSQNPDVVWLVRNMFRQLPSPKMPGFGLLPHDWLDGELVANGLRSISRLHQNLLLHYGTQQGFLPLRQQLQLKLAELEIAAAPEQIVMTNGVTQALDLVAREFTQPGDTIFVDDPAWFLMFGTFATLGTKVIGIPRLQDGPDIQKLVELAAIHKPKLYIIHSVLHSPTSTSLSAAKAFQVLKAAEQFDFKIVEDDVYCDFHPGSSVQAATRISALDQLNRVIYLGGFSKTLAANLRVGFIATSPDLAIRLSDRKMLSTITTNEIGERIVHKILSEGHYRKHIDRIRVKLDSVRDVVTDRIERIGMKVEYRTPAGMFLWVETGCDTIAMTEKALEQGILIAPGTLFSPNQLPSTRMRVNIAAMSDEEVWTFLENEMHLRDNA